MEVTVIGCDIMKNKKFGLIFSLIFLLVPVAAFPHDPVVKVNPINDPENPYYGWPDTIPMDPISVQSGNPYQMIVPSGSEFELLFHINGTDGQGKFTFALFQIEQQAPPLSPNFSSYTKQWESADRSVMEPDNISRTYRHASRYKNDQHEMVDVIELISTETIDGLFFTPFYETGFNQKGEPRPVDNSDKALFVVYFEGEGNGTVNFVDYHLSWIIVLRGGDASISSSSAQLQSLPFLGGMMIIMMMRSKKHSGRRRN